MKQVIVVTGATGGIGKLLCTKLSNANRHIIGIGRREAALTQMQQQLNNPTEGTFSYQVADMQDESSVNQAAAEIKQHHGHIDLWINNVGVNHHDAMGPTWEISAEVWCKEVHANLFSAFLGSRAAVNAMKSQRSGYIVNLGGGGADTPKTYGSAYGCAKAAVVKFTETLAQELAAENTALRAFCFNPGFIRNKRTEKLVDSEVATKYMPNLREVMRHGKMSNIDDSIWLLEAILAGKLDQQNGGYFMADTVKQDLEIKTSEKQFLLRHI